VFVCLLCLCVCLHASLQKSVSEVHKCMCVFGFVRLWVCVLAYVSVGVCACVSVPVSVI
jgi:hypothetical protein